MDGIRVFLVCAIISAGLLAETAAQTVYRCKQSDGSIEFSDLPCASDIGEADQVDARHHQGEAPPPAEPASSGRLPPGFHEDSDPDRSRPAPPSRRPERSAFDSELSRGERQSLEVERNRVLSDLRRRHISDERRRELISELRKTDRELGIQPGGVDNLPYHDRDVYEENRVYQGAPRREIRKPDRDG